MFDPFTNAVCRQDQYRQDAIERGGFPWDHRIEGESDAKRLDRYREAVALCQGCPNLRDRSCEREHNWVEYRYGEHSGVWAGVVHEPGTDSASGLLRLI